jgi:soluble lytic murein transglycosylase-like protein
MRLALSAALGGLVLALACAAALWAGAGEPEASAADSRALQTLLRAVRDRAAARALPADLLAAVPAEALDADPLAPYASYLVGEAWLLRGDRDAARGAFDRLAAWGASDPHGDRSGGSPLCLVALWRWLRLLADSSSVSQADALEAFERADALRDALLSRRLLHFDFHAALPDLEEQIELLLTDLGARAGFDHDVLENQLLRYLRVHSASELPPVAARLESQMLGSGRFEPKRWALFRGKRLLELRRFEAAEQHLRVAAESEDANVRAGAALALSSLPRYRDGECRARLALLDEARELASDPSLRDQALFERAIFVGSARCGSREDRLVADLERLVAESPKGSLAARALYNLARVFDGRAIRERIRGEPPEESFARAMAYYERLRSLEAGSDFVESSWFWPGLTHYRLGRPGDPERARRLLRDCVERHPAGVYAASALFWAARISEEMGDGAEAVRLLRRVVEVSPFSYYGVRARLHLAVGSEARGRYWPDDATAAELRAAFVSSTLDGRIAPESPYHRRFAAVVESGIYVDALETLARLREAWPDVRPQEIPLEQLERRGLLAEYAVFLALRLDALSAFDSSDDPADRLRVAAAVARVRDVPMQLVLVRRGSEEFPNLSGRLQREGGQYLRIAYPPRHLSDFETAGAAFGVSPSLLYSVALHESLFDAYALSSRGAVGLFQFMPDTFRSLDRRWKLQKGRPAQGPAVFLADPQQSIRLGARWFAEELLPRQGRREVFAVMEHHAGAKAVRRWREAWRREGREEDVEYVIETTPFLDTRKLSRQVLESAAIAYSVGLFVPPSGGGGAPAR